ncbi:MAG: hypothetical protein N4A44_03905 [Alphaproteobacteria bacterium]|jgi:hypothetical protein|nr:hypothetical protein [Alphaproteobacteria bacterium]
MNNKIRNTVNINSLKILNNKFSKGFISREISSKKEYYLETSDKKFERIEFNECFIKPTCRNYSIVLIHLEDDLITTGCIKSEFVYININGFKFKLLERIKLNVLSGNFILFEIEDVVRETAEPINEKNVELIEKIAS